MSLPRTNVSLVGPAGSGKTTALAYLCAKLDGFPKPAHEECRDLAKEMGCPPAEHAWMLDALRSEREAGHSERPALGRFNSESFAFTGIDTPGAQHLCKGLLSTASLADIAVVVVSAAAGEWEAGLASGQLREMAVACFTMGVKNIAVWVNKMDDMSVAEDPGARFEDIKKAMHGLLKDAGYKQKEQVSVVPISARVGLNMTAPSTEFDWYEGKSAVEALDAVGPIARPAEKPLRLPVLRVYSCQDGGTVVVGRVEAGTVKSGTKVLFAPGGLAGEVQSIKRGGEAAGEAKAGDIVSVALGDSVESESLRRGAVMSQAGSDPAAEAETFVAQVVVLDGAATIRSGFCPSIVVHTAQVPCEFEELVSVMDRKTKTSVPNPAKVGSGEVVTVKMRPRTGVSVETFAAYPSLGRFAVRDNGRTIGVGVIKEVTKRGAKAE